MFHGRTELPNLSRIRAATPAAVRFFDRRRGVMSTLGGGLFATRDGGRSWRRIGRLRADEIAVVSGAVAYASGRQGLLRTLDRGVHWRRLARVAGALSYADARHGWILGRRPLATDDGGRTLRPLRLPCDGAESAAASRVSLTLGFAACGSQPGTGQQLKRLYVTRDGGRSWRLRADGRRMPSGGYLAGISFRDARHGLMRTARGGLLATRDGGRTWRTLLFTDDVTDVASVQRVGVSLVVLLRNGALLRSRGGAHWRLVWPPTLPRAVGDVTFSTARAGIGIGPGDWWSGAQAIVRTRDGGRTWHLLSRLPRGAMPSQLVRASRRVVLAVGLRLGRGHAILFRSRDEGRTWAAVGTPQGSASFRVSFTSSRDGFLGDDAGRFYSTSDGGAHWRLARAGGEDLRTFVFLTRRRGLAIAGDRLLETRDGGRTWHAYRVPRVRRPLVLGSLGARRLWIVDMPPCSEAVLRRQPLCPGAVVRSADGGHTWTRIELNMVPTITRLDFVTTREGFAAEAGLGLYRSTDGGRTWRLVHPPPLAGR